MGAASKDRKSRPAQVCEHIEGAIRAAVEIYEKEHNLEWCDGSYDPDEIRQAAEMLVSAKDTQVCICLDYALGFNRQHALDPFNSEDADRTSRIHLRGNAASFAVELMERGGCVNHENVLIPRLDLLSRGKTALIKAAEGGNADAMFALSRLFDQGIGESSDPVEAYFWHFVGTGFLDDDCGCEGLVDAAADQERLAAKISDHRVFEDGSLHGRAKDWITAHRAGLPKGNDQDSDFRRRLGILG